MKTPESDILENLNLDELKQALRDTMHEVREFNRIVKANSEMLTRQLRIEEDGPLQLSAENAKNIRNHAIAILETAQMLSARLDVPPVLSSAAIWSPIPTLKEIGREKALYRRTNHRLST
ncbi:hypothetical protein [Marilutibacter chinensis]|uniref:Uncharacterized protein n=1 Tax=Marilutibacter chinensis TaxID=2912247 RepID=A0ABS9HZT7_9GAMM|nr:hypothetical protein [Lysobacter chinensis]MCF7223700.1 hypothetical protein [Lysobacter chinensis]